MYILLVKETTKAKLLSICFSLLVYKYIANKYLTSFDVNFTIDNQIKENYSELIKSTYRNRVTDIISFRKGIEDVNANKD